MSSLLPDYHVHCRPIEPTAGIKADYSAYIAFDSTLQPTVGVEVGVEVNASIYRSTAYIAFDLQPVLRYSLL